MHAKYEVSTSNGSKVIANVKVDNRQTDRQTNKQTGQKQYAPDHSIRGIKRLTVTIQDMPLKSLIGRGQDGICRSQVSIGRGLICSVGANLNK